MDVGQLRSFLAVAEELHFGRAAERLNVSQPPLSRTIKRLERELGAQLFERNTRSVALTAVGHVLVPAAREALAAIRRAELSVIAATRGEVGHARIAFAGTSTHALIGQLARSIHSTHPGIVLELSSQNFAQPAMKRLLEGHVDLVLGRWDVMPPSVTTEVIEKDSLVMAMPSAHHLAGSAEVSIRQLKQDSFVSLPAHEGAVLQDRLRSLATTGGFAPTIVQIAPDTPTALALVSAEVGLLLTLRSVADVTTDPHVAFVRLIEKMPSVDLRVAWRTGDPNPVLGKVVDCLLHLSDDAT